MSAGGDVKYAPWLSEGRGCDLAADEREDGEDEGAPVPPALPDAWQAAAANGVADGGLLAWPWFADVTSTLRGVARRAPGPCRAPLCSGGRAWCWSLRCE